MAEITVDGVVYRTLEVIGLPDYAVSKLGGVMSGKGRRWVPRRLYPSTAGYVQVTLNCGEARRSFRVHRLVLLAFDRLPVDGEQCCHANGNRADNRLENLRWGSAQDNYNDRVVHGTVGHTRNIDVFLERITALKQCVIDGQTNAEIAERFGLSVDMISKISQCRRYIKVASHLNAQMRNAREKMYPGKFSPAFKAGHAARRRTKTC